MSVDDHMAALQEPRLAQLGIGDDWTANRDPAPDVVTDHIAGFVMPVLANLVAGEQFDRRWSLGGPWE